MACSTAWSASVTGVRSGLLITCRSSALKRSTVIESASSASTWARRRSSVKSTRVGELPDAGPEIGMGLRLRCAEPNSRSIRTMRRDCLRWPSRLSALLSAMEWSVTGLPLHILVIHAAVVFGPLAALSALAYVALPRYRDLLRWPTLVLALIAFGSIWAAYLTGQNFFDSDRFANFSGEALREHRDPRGLRQDTAMDRLGLRDRHRGDDLLLPQPRGHRAHGPVGTGRHLRGGDAGVGGADRRRRLPRGLELASARSGR